MKLIKGLLKGLLVVVLLCIACLFAYVFLWPLLPFLCAGLPTGVIRLSPAAKAQLDRIAEHYGMKEQAAFAGLCASGLAIFNKKQHQQNRDDRLTEQHIAIPFVATRSRPKAAQFWATGRSYSVQAIMNSHNGSTPYTEKVGQSFAYGEKWNCTAGA